MQRSTRSARILRPGTPEVEDQGRQHSMTVMSETHRNARHPTEPGCPVQHHGAALPFAFPLPASPVPPPPLPAHIQSACLRK
eukprot:354149-Chlamydomonas_euryale.AAC.2